MNASTILTAVSGKPDEWPAYLAFRENVPEEIRICVAAIMAERTTPKLAQLLDILSKFEVDQKFFIVDLYDAQSDELTKEQSQIVDLILYWLAGGPNEISALRQLEPIGGISEDLKSVTGLAIQACTLRWSDLEHLSRELERGYFKDDFIRRLATSICEATMEGKGRDAAPPDLSPFLRSVWAKHCGDLAFVHGNCALAASLYEDASENASQLPQQSTCNKIQRRIELSRLSTKSLHGDHESVVQCLSKLRRDARGRDFAETTELALSIAQHRKAVEQDDVRRISSRVRPLLLRSYDVATRPLEISNTALSIAMEDNDPSRAELFFFHAKRTAMGMGLHALTHEIAASRAFAILTNIPKEGRVALEEIIYSGQISAVRPLKQPKEKLNILREIFDDDLLTRLSNIANRDKGLILERNATLSKTLTCLTDLGSWPEESKLLLFDKLRELTLSGCESSLTNIDASRSALEGIAKLAMSAPDRLLDLRKDEIAEILRYAINSERHWPTIDLGLRIALSCVDEMNESVSSQTNDLVLNFLDTEFNRLSNDWVLTRRLMTFLQQPATVKKIKRDAFTLGKTKELIRKYCFASQSGPYEVAWEFAFPLAEAYEVDLPENGRSQISRNLKAAAMSNASSSANALIRLLQFPRLLNRDDLRAIVESLKGIVDFRAEYGGPSPAIGECAIAVFELTNRWSEIETKLEEGDRQGLDKLYASIEKFVEEAASDVSFFSAPSFPRDTTPNSATVFNWAYAIQSLSKKLNKTERANEFLKKVAEKNRDLRLNITRAISEFKVYGSSEIAGSSQTIDLENIKSGDDFYALLSELVVQTTSSTSEGRPSAISELVHKSFLFGPRIEDLAVFGIALGEPTLRGHIERVQADEYLSRLTNSGSALSKQQVDLLYKSLALLLTAIV